MKSAVLPHQGSQESASISDEAVESIRADLRRAILRERDTAEDRAAVVLELNASRAAEQEVEHSLARFASLLPDNPRVMKRMINAFAMRQAIGFLERNTAPPEVLARWTVLEQRLPALADLLIENSEWTDMIPAEIGEENRAKLPPPPLLPFINSDVVLSIVGKADDNGLTGEIVRTITRGSAK